MNESLQTLPKDYIQSNQERFIAELLDWLRIPSVSAKSEHKNDVRNAALFLKEKLENAGAENVRLYETAGYPIVYADKMIDPALPTVVVYGHYDVQPPEPLDLWTTPPFEPEIRDGKIYARGACDDKGQAYMHVKAFETMMQTESLPCNVKFMIEGEEEVGSDNLDIFVKAHAELLQGDVMLISDTSIISLEHPSITVGLRGMCYMEVEVTGPSHDLHSGVYGGAVANPINVLSQLIADMMDADGRIQIPGFYDKVAELSAAEREALNSAPYNEGEYKAALGVKALKGEKGYTTLERVGVRPTLDVNGIWGGWTGEGAKTVLPSKASAKISMRLVPDQDHKEIEELFKAHFNAVTPDYVTVNVITHHGGQAAVTPTDSVSFKAATEAYKEVWGKTPIPTRDGGSIPIVSLFKDELKLDSLLLGFGLDSDLIHSPNEHYGVQNYMLGIETIVAFYKHFTELNK